MSVFKKRLTQLYEQHRVYKPSGYFLVPEGEERVGDVSNIVFSNGWILDDNGTVFIYIESKQRLLFL